MDLEGLAKLYNDTVVNRDFLKSALDAAHERNAEMRERIAKMEREYDEAKAIMEELKPLFDKGLTLKGIVDGFSRLEANNSALRARIQELEGAAEAREDAIGTDCGDDRHTKTWVGHAVFGGPSGEDASREDLIDPTVHAEEAQDGKPETTPTPFDWIEEAVRAGDAKEIKVEFNLLERQLLAEERECDIAKALTGGLVRHMIGNQPDDVHAGYELVRIVEKFMRRK